MFMNQQDVDAEAFAKEQLDFYGFWLWTYSHSEFGYLDPGEALIGHYSHLDRKARCNSCYQHREFCATCSVPIVEKKNLFIKAVFSPGANIIIEDVLNGERLRMSSCDILNYYYSTSSNLTQIPNTQFRYIPNMRPVVLKLLSIAEKEIDDVQHAKITTSKEATISIDLSMPFDIIANELENFYYANTERESLHFKDINSFYLDNYGPKTSYRAVLKNLKTYSDISFSASACATRALGFWLWDTTKNKKSFTSVIQAIDYLRSGEEFPKDLLDKLGFAASETTIFNRICRLTEICIYEKEVCSIG